METLPSQAPEVDLHRLELRFTQTRLLEPRAIAALAQSIEQSGQLSACVAVPAADSTRLILVDGYRRVHALRRLGRDTARVDAWTCDLAQALLSVLAHSGRRPFAAIEEALLLQELVHGQGLSEREVARRSGRDVSWVSRRLALVCGVSESVLGAVRQGTLSTWAATRVLAPLARANPAHATQLLSALATTPLSTRDLQAWFAHYQRSPRTPRERMVAQPRLFIQSLRAQAEQGADIRLRAGPEGQSATEVRQLLALSRRLRERLPALRREGHSAAFLDALIPLQRALAALQSELTRSLDHDPEPDPRCRTHPASARPEPAPDQPSAAALA